MVGESIATRVADTTRNAARYVYHECVPGPFGFLVLLVLAGVHFLDWSRGFPLDAEFILIYATVGIGLAIVAFFFTDAKSIRLAVQFLLRYLLVALFLGAGIPRLFGLLYDFQVGSNFITELGFFLLLLFPPLIIYILYDPDYDFPIGLRKIVSSAMAVVLFLIVVSFLWSITIPFSGGLSGVDPAEGAGNAWDRIKNGLGNFNSRIFDQLNKTQSALNPYSYMGQIEQNKDKPLGVKITNAAPISPIFLPEQEPIIRASINAETFLDRPIQVVPTCVITKKLAGRDRPFDPGSVQPESLKVYGGYAELFSCTFSEEYPKGIYPVEIEASFDFETWADVTYDFVKEEQAIVYARQQKNINQELDIDKIPLAIYTGGPVAIGMTGASSTMPVWVTQEPPYLKNAHLGFTLQSRWPQGRLAQVNELELLLPKEFVIDNCDRKNIEGFTITKNGEPVEDLPDYYAWTIENKGDAALTFTSLRCNLELASENAFPDLATLDKVSRTFILKTKYTYVIKDTTEFRVQG